MKNNERITFSTISTILMTITGWAIVFSVFFLSLGIFVWTLKFFFTQFIIK